MAATDAVAWAIVMIALLGGSGAVRPGVLTGELDSSLGDGAERTSKVLYVVRTSEKTVDTRLPAVLDTWAASLPADSLLVVGAPTSDAPNVYPATGCSDGHGRSLSCKTAFSLSLAASKMGAHDWVFVADDDLYVNTTNVERKLQEVGDPSRLEAHGIPDCDDVCSPSPGGFCGGAGYIMSRAALEATVHNSEPVDFRAEFMQQYDKLFGVEADVPWDDVCASCLMQERSITLNHLDGLNPLRMETEGIELQPGEMDPKLQEAIHSAETLPLSFHYLRPEEMHMVHEEFAKPTPTNLLEVAGQREVASYAKQLDMYILEQNRLRRYGRH